MKPLGDGTAAGTSTEPFETDAIERLANQLFQDLAPAAAATGIDSGAPFAFLEPTSPPALTGSSFPVSAPAPTPALALAPGFLGPMELTTAVPPLPTSLDPTTADTPLGFTPIDPAGLYWLRSDAVATGTSQAIPASQPQGSTYAPEVVSDLHLSPGFFDVASVRRDFPILDERVHDRPLIWLDNAATTQKPRSVIQRLALFYERENSNIHRGAHALAARSTDAYEAARDKVRAFLNAPSAREIVFVRGATEAINLVAQTWGRQNLRQGDEIVLTWLEHHSNIVPWQLLAAEKGAVLRVAPIDSRGQVILEEYQRLLGPRTRLVALTQVSNALGTIVPVQEMTAMAHRHGARVLVDGAQSVSHLRVDVQALDADFFAFSGHKVFGPTGIGVLYGKAEVLESMPPWQGGGNMIRDVTFERTVYENAPARFEAGTGNIADAVGLGAAIDYLERIGIENVTRHEAELLEHGTQALGQIPGLRLIGTAREKAGVLSFVLDGFRSEDVGKALDLEGIAVRAGHHCAQPALRRFGLESTVRPSLALYNTHEEIDALAASVRRIRSR